MYWCQLNFALFSATFALVISWQSLNHPNLLAVYRFHAYFHVHLIGTFIESAYNVICNDYGVNPDETWLYGNWFYTTSYAIFTSELKATKRSQMILVDGSLADQKALREKVVRR